MTNGTGLYQKALSGDEDAVILRDDVVDDRGHLLHALLHATADPVHQDLGKHPRQRRHLVGAFKAVGGDEQVGL